MNPYPTIDEVEAADRMQLARWVRFLPGPGESAVGASDFDAVLEGEKAVLERILERFEDLGGMTPAISKAIGW